MKKEGKLAHFFAYLITEIAIYVISIGCATLILHQKFSFTDYQMWMGIAIVAMLTALFNSIINNLSLAKSKERWNKLIEKNDDYHNHTVKEGVIFLRLLQKDEKRHFLTKKEKEDILTHMGWDDDIV